jgi:hypothetical protein
MRRGYPTLLVLLALLLPPALAGCLDAESLGDQPPTVVPVGSPPQWNNGVMELMQLKCGVCHRVPRSEVSPVYVPQTFDLNYQVSSPSGVPGAQDPLVLARIGAGILRGPVAGKPRMPLDYATPLVPAEITALETWAAAGGP